MLLGTPGSAALQEVFPSSSAALSFAIGGPMEEGRCSENLSLHPIDDSEPLGLSQSAIRDFSSLFYPAPLVAGVASALRNASSDYTIPLTLVIGWGLLVLYSTFLKTNSPASVKILSLRSSLAELLDQRNRGTPLDTLDIFRFCAIAWILLNHLGSEGRLDVLDRLPSGAAFKDAIHSHPVFGPLVGNSALGVEIFLVLSGLLASKSWERRVAVHGGKGFWKNTVAFLVRRVLRIVPVVWVYIYLASGPLMKAAIPK